jgi:folylpolyglutamate synthase
MSTCRVCMRRAISQSRSFSSGRRLDSAARDYNAAVQALNGLQSNYAIVEAIRKTGPESNKLAIPEMIAYIRRVGYEVCVLKYRSTFRIIADIYQAVGF